MIWELPHLFMMEQSKNTEQGTQQNKEHSRTRNTAEQGTQQSREHSRAGNTVEQQTQNRGKHHRTGEHHRRGGGGGGHRAGNKAEQGINEIRI